MYGQAIKNEFVKRKKDLIILTVMITIIMYFLMGNNSMIRVATSDLSQTSGNMILDKCFSFSYNNIIVLFFICAILVGVLFKNKEQEFDKILENKEAKRELFFNKIITIVSPIFGAIFINSLIKIIVYYAFKKVFYVQYGIEVGVIMTFIIYAFLLTLIFAMIMFLFNVMIKDPWMATIIPGFIFDGFILTFNINLFFISEKLYVIKEIVAPIENLAGNIMELLYLNIRLENQNKDVQINLFIILTILIILILCIIYMLLSRLTKKKIQKPYASGFIRHIFYLSISFIIGFYSVSFVGYVLLLNNPNIGYEEGLFTINIIAFITVILIYIILNLVYKFTSRKYIKNDNSEISGNDYESNKEEILKSKDNIEEIINDGTIEDNNMSIEEDDEDTQNIKNFLLMDTKEINNINKKEIGNNEDINKEDINETIIENEELIENINEVERNNYTEIKEINTEDSLELYEGIIDEEKEIIEKLEEIKDGSLDEEKDNVENEKLNEDILNDRVSENEIIEQIENEIKEENTEKEVREEIIEQTDTYINEINIEENSIVESIIEEIAREENNMEDQLVIVESINSLKDENNSNDKH